VHQGRRKPISLVRALVPADRIAIPNWQIGDRFNNNLKNPMSDINAFANPDAYTIGTLGRPPSGSRVWRAPSPQPAPWPPHWWADVST